jgi:general L-amino acid transport system permease protein
VIADDASPGDQALRIALPAMTNEFIALFKNTTLVLIVSIFDLLGIAQAALADPPGSA